MAVSGASFIGVRQYSYIVHSTSRANNLDYTDTISCEGSYLGDEMISSNNIRTSNSVPVFFIATLLVACSEPSRDSTDYQSSSIRITADLLAKPLTNEIDITAKALAGGTQLRLLDGDRIVVSRGATSRNLHRRGVPFDYVNTLSGITSENIRFSLYRGDSTNPTPDELSIAMPSRPMLVSDIDGMEISPDSSVSVTWTINDSLPNGTQYAIQTLMSSCQTASGQFIDIAVPSQTGGYILTEPEVLQNQASLIVRDTLTTYDNPPNQAAKCTAVLRMTARNSIPGSVEAIHPSQEYGFTIIQGAQQ